MKISVAGTGFASFICIKYLVSKGIKPIVFDLDNKINEIDKMAIKTQSILKEKNFSKYLNLGGLSNIWAGVIDKYSKNDLSRWPINNNELEINYDEVFKILNQAEISSFYNKSNKDIFDYDIKKISGLNENNIYADERLLIKYTSLLTNKTDPIKKEKKFLDNLVPLCFKQDIIELIKDSKVEFRNEKIVKISENLNRVTIETLTATNQKKKIVCDYLFIGCGAISTYLIIKNSFENFDENIKIKSSKKIVFPVKLKRIKDFENKFFNTFPIIQINGLSKSNLSIYSQIYNLNTNIINYIFPKLKKLKNYLFLLKYFKNFGFSYFSLGSEFSDQFIIDNKNDIIIHEKKLKTHEIISSCQSLFDKTFFDGQILHLRFSAKMKSLSGNHFGSSFPMKKDKKNFFESDIFGRIGNFKKTSIIDSSVFPNLSACPPTLTILANSLRITKEVIKYKFFNHDL